MLPLISFRSKIPGLVSVGERPLGKIHGKKAVSLPAMDKATLFVRFSPLCNDQDELYAQLSFGLEFRGGKLHPLGCPYVHVSIWDDRLFVFTLSPPKLAAHSLPYTVCYQEIGDYLASVLYQNNYYLIIEHKRNEQPDFFCPLHFSGDKVTLETMHINGKSILLVGDHHSRLYGFMETEQGFINLCEYTATDWMSASDSLAVTQVLASAPHRIITYYTFSGGQPEIKETKYDIQTTTPQDEQSLCLEFLECVHHGLADRCQALMTEELKSGLSYADLQEFFGSFTAFYPSPYGNHNYALEYLEEGGNYRIKQFTFQMNESKIDNIEECT